jgi:hypothetical protein
MSIGRAEKRGNLVFVHDDEGQLRFVRIGEIHAQTGSAVSIERDGIVTTFDEAGREIAQARMVGNDLAPPRPTMRQAVGAR